MDLHDLGTPAQLWHRWVLLAAGQAAASRSGCRIRHQDGCGLLEDDRGGWVRMRRLAGDRAIVWSHHPRLDVADDLVPELLDAAPDWAYDQERSVAWRDDDVGFLAWFAQGSWSSVPGRMPAVCAALLAPVCSDEVVRDWWRTTWPEAPHDRIEAVLAAPEGPVLDQVVGAAGTSRASRQLALGRSWSDHPISDAATGHLRAQIYAQMRGAGELTDRGHPRRPTLLRQWARVNLDGLPFRHAVCAIGQGTTPVLARAVNNAGLDEGGMRSLDNVLHEIRMLETDERSGAWLFARVASDGRSVELDRRYDSWPGWYVALGAGPPLVGLHHEMTQRAPRWRPPWSTLLPAEGA